MRGSGCVCAEPGHAAGQVLAAAGPAANPCCPFADLRADRRLCEPLALKTLVTVAVTVGPSHARACYISNEHKPVCSYSADQHAAWSGAV